jgi:RND family efflux transporter MFP subunit
MPQSKTVRILRLLLVCGFALVLATCDQDKPARPAASPPAPAVTVAKPVNRLVSDRDEYVGRFVAIDYVEVRARVSGYLDVIHFRDGEMVRRGQPLFTLDRRPFQTILDQARASLEQARANLAFAENDLKRGESLPRGTVMTQQTYEQRLQAKSVAAASVAAQDGAVHQVELDLSFTELIAPTAGRIGDRRVSVGNLVTGGTTGNTTLLATIASTDPIRLEFTLDEASYLKYLRIAGPAAGSANRGMTLPVRLKLLDEADFHREGNVDFVDNVIDRSSGTIRVRAEFPNPDGVLTPGMFGRVEVAAGPPAEALLVPDTAIGTEQTRKFVLVVDAQNKTYPKYVTLGAVVNGLRVIDTGLTPDDVIIVNGLMRVRPGMTVTPQEGAPGSALAQGEKVPTN